MSRPCSPPNELRLSSTFPPPVEHVTCKHCGRTDRVGVVRSAMGKGNGLERRCCWCLRWQFWKRG